jgi:NAD(P)-dependent dehydrogenase (short-subunit alcohol dehydrogenase family)
MSKSKQIIITGISSELGTVLARAFGKRKGIHIIGTMRRAKKKTDRFPRSVVVIDGCDLTQPSCCKQVAEEASDRFKGPFGFIHSVGDFWNHDSFLDVGPEKASSMFASHVTTFYNVLQSIIPVMQSHKGGCCIAFSCNSVRYNYPKMASFTASKGAVESLVRSLAHEFSGDGLRFNSLVLASLRTQKVRDSKPHGDFAHFIPPKDLVPVIEFLLSKESYLVNGNAINLFRHSEQFYKTGYFARIAREP